MLTELEFLTFILLKFLLFFPHQEKARTWGKKSLLFARLDTKDIGQCLHVKDHPTKMGATWLYFGCLSSLQDSLGS